MSFPIAFQSAVFYFVACTPCAQMRHRQKAKEQAKKEREEKAKLETDQPNLYRHPSPFNTNPYWQQEIEFGPRLPKRSAGKNSSQNGLMSSAHGSGPPSVSDNANTESSCVNIDDSTTAIPEDESVSEDWNRRHGYQREDEELWGQWSGHRLMDAFSKARDSAGRLIDSMRVEREVTEQERRDFYFSPRNPPVNDYHPPVVSSKAPCKIAHKWMLQPPPPAKIMEGKVPVSRAMSSASKTSSKTLIGEEVPLGRMVPEKLMKEKMKKEAPTEDELINSLFGVRTNQTSTFVRSRRLSLDCASFESSHESLSSPLERRGTRTQPAAVPAGSRIDCEEDYDVDRNPPCRRLSATSHTAHHASDGHAIQRPKLETIHGSGSLGSTRR